MQTRSLPQQIAANVRAEMARAQVSIKEMADSVGMKPDALSKRLRGVVLFSTPELGLVADRLGLTFSDLTGRSAREEQASQVSPAPSGASPEADKPMDPPAASATSRVAS